MTTQHTLLLSSMKALVGGRTSRYYVARCSCGAYHSEMESSRAHAVEGHRRHVAAATQREVQS